MAIDCSVKLALPDTSQAVTFLLEIDHAYGPVEPARDHSVLVKELNGTHPAIVEVCLKDGSNFKLRF